jgi:copper chaperone NosL
MANANFSLSSKILLGVSSLLLFSSVFLPIWRIELNAPQYPEGLAMLIYANKLGGDVDIINGLNHYIGMQTLHAENFIEFTLLPYIISFFALFSLFALFAARKKVLYVLFTAFVLFGIIAMVDFWRWEYNYGHNLDPTAAIIVPGMAYQPPLIGFKQLLNFGAYSIPDIGGWMFIISGLCMLVATLLEAGVFIKTRKVQSAIVTFLLIPVSVLIYSCGSMNPDPIRLNKDNCDFCKMTISDGRFACELISKKSRVYKFDDLGCMIRFKEENSKIPVQSFYVNDFSQPNILIPAENSFYLTSDQFNSPMGGNTAAFKEKSQAQFYSAKYNTAMKTWQLVCN